VSFSSALTHIPRSSSFKLQASRSNTLGGSFSTFSALGRVLARKFSKIYVPSSLGSTPKVLLERET
jgi:hypothetical protein